jgi:hypothetical protein
MSKSFDQFRRDNIVTALPTTLEYGKEVYYKDAFGNLTLWVGHEDGTAWPAVGYKELVIRLNQTGSSALQLLYTSNNTGIPFTITGGVRQEAGRYYIMLGLNNSTFIERYLSVLSLRYSLLNNEIRTVRVTQDYIGGSPSASTSALRIDTFNASGYAEMNGTLFLEYRVYP